MKTTLTRFLLATALLTLSALPALAANPRVMMETSLGKVTLELDAEHAPATVENFLKYVDEGYYDGTVFHRVIDGFMIQGGGFDRELVKRNTHDPIQNEADNGLKNLRGTIAMARTNQPHSATSQFFVNLVDNGFLDFREKNRMGWGYCVFGKVVEGMDVVDKIKGVKTGSRGGHQDVPAEDVVLQRAEIC